MRPSMMMMMMMVMVVVGKTAAQSRCDPITQYEKAGQCCKLCSPGTSMSTQSTCLEPQCIECGEKEYQDIHNREQKCHRQPYCDPNKNFLASTQESKKKRTTCMCQLGFHCSSETCITCVPHTTCKPGHWAQSKGNQTHDTVCQKCPEGSFSNISSWNTVCTKWTECESGYHIQQSGTDISDNVCVKSSHQHVGLIILISVIACLVAILGIAYCLCRGDAKCSKKASPDSWNREQQEQQRVNLLIFTPVDDTKNGPLLIEHPSSQEECSMRTPEENIEDESDEMLKGVIITENGNCVTQETGKEEVQSQQETQTLTYTN